ncbi:MAG TPA: hypothetical protein VIM14_19600, partial [Polyangia bacterium]
VVKRGLNTPQDLKLLVDKHGELPTTIPEDYFVDWGQTAPFTLAGRGPGECGAGVLDIVRADLDEGSESLTRAAEQGQDIVSRGPVGEHFQLEIRRSQ